MRQYSEGGGGGGGAVVFATLRLVGIGVGDFTYGVRNDFQSAMQKKSGADRDDVVILG